MGGYLKTQTAEKLQDACDAIKKASNVYVISELCRLGFISERDARNRFEIMGIKLGRRDPDRPRNQPQFIPTRVLAKILGITTDEANWFWYAYEIFTTHDPEAGQAVTVGEMKAFLENNPEYAQRVKEYLPMTEEERRALHLLKD